MTLSEFNFDINLNNTPIPLQGNHHCMRDKKSSNVT